VATMPWFLWGVSLSSLALATCVVSVEFVFRSSSIYKKRCAFSRVPEKMTFSVWYLLPVFTFDDWLCDISCNFLPYSVCSCQHNILYLISCMKFHRVGPWNLSMDCVNSF
jgi:hypothetical protein